MSEPNPNRPVMELRIALTTRDYERLVKFYCEGLGLEPAQVWTNEGGGHGLMLEMGTASLEIFDEAYAHMVDEVEAGRHISEQVRLALRVTNLQEAMDRLLSRGATLVHPPVVTPWGDQNVRLLDPDGMQITVYQVPE